MKPKKKLSDLAASPPKFKKKKVLVTQSTKDLFEELEKESKSAEKERTPKLAAFEMFLEVTETLEHRHSFADIAHKLSKVYKKKYDGQLIHAWAVKHGWRDLFNEARDIALQSGAEKLNEAFEEFLLERRAVEVIKRREYNIKTFWRKAGVSILKKHQNSYISAEALIAEAATLNALYFRKILDEGGERQLIDLTTSATGTSGKRTYHDLWVDTWDRLMKFVSPNVTTKKLSVIAEETGENLAPVLNKMTPKTELAGDAYSLVLQLFNAEKSTLEAKKKKPVNFAEPAGEDCFGNVEDAHLVVDPEEVKSNQKDEASKKGQDGE